MNKVEKLSHLTFGLVHADPLATRGLDVTEKELDRPEDLIL